MLLNNLRQRRLRSRTSFSLYPDSKQQYARRTLEAISRVSHQPWHDLDMLRGRCERLEEWMGLVWLVTNILSACACKRAVSFAEHGAVQTGVVGEVFPNRLSSSKGGGQSNSEHLQQTAAPRQGRIRLNRLDRGSWAL